MRVYVTQSMGVHTILYSTLIIFDNMYIYILAEEMHEEKKFVNKIGMVRNVFKSTHELYQTFGTLGYSPKNLQRKRL